MRRFEMSVQEVETDLNKMIETDPAFRQIVSKLFPSMPRYRYWQVKLKALEPHVRKSLNRKKRLHKKDNRLFGFTVETLMDKGRPRYYAFIYRVKQLPRHYENLHLVRKVGFARKKKARERAYEWYCERVEQLKAKGVEVT
jgi:hypothetical protein